MSLYDLIYEIYTSTAETTQCAFILRFLKPSAWQTSVVREQS